MDDELDLPTHLPDIELLGASLGEIVGALMFMQHDAPVTDEPDCMELVAVGCTTVRRDCCHHCTLLLNESLIADVILGTKLIAGMSHPLMVKLSLCCNHGISEETLYKCMAQHAAWAGILHLTTFDGRKTDFMAVTAWTIQQHNDRHLWRLHDDRNIIAIVSYDSCDIFGANGLFSLGFSQITGSHSQENVPPCALEREEEPPQTDRAGDAPEHGG